MKIVEFGNIIDPDEAAHFEQPRLDLQTKHIAPVDATHYKPSRPHLHYLHQ